VARRLPDPFGDEASLRDIHDRRGADGTSVSKRRNTSLHQNRVVLPFVLELLDVQAGVGARVGIIERGHVDHASRWNLGLRSSEGGLLLHSRTSAFGFDSLAVLLLKLSVVLNELAPDLLELVMGNVEAA